MNGSEKSGGKLIRVSPRVLCQEIGGEAVLLDLDSERYFGLDEVGLRIWQLLQQHDSAEPIVDTLAAEFEAPPATIAEDYEKLIGQLAEAGLVKVT